MVGSSGDGRTSPRGRGITQPSRRTVLKGLGASAALAALAASGSTTALGATTGAGADSRVALSFTAGERTKFPFNALVYQEWQKRTNVKFNWQLISTASLAQKVQLLMGSGDTTDIIEYTRAGLIAQGPQACKPVDSLIDKYMPNYSKFINKYKGQIPSSRSSDGKMYGIWGQSDQVYTGWLYRKDLADQYGIKSLVTLNDWHDYLQAAKQHDPSVLGISIYGDILNVLFSIRGAFGITGQMVTGSYTTGPWITMQNGKLIDASITSNAQQAVSTMRTWFSEKLIDPDLVVGVNGQDVQQKWLSGTVIAGIDDYLDYTSLTDTYRQSHPSSTFELVAAVPAKGPNGSQANTFNDDGWGYFAYGIGHNCKNPAAACRALDYWYTDEGVTLKWMGVEGKTFSKSGSTYKFLPTVYDQIQKDIQAGLTEVVAPMDALEYQYGIGDTFMASPHTFPPANVIAAYTSGSQPMITPGTIASQSLESPHMATILQTPQYTAAETQQITQMSADIDTFRSENLTKFMTGQQAMSGWNEYVSQMKSLGIDKVMATVTKAYDRTNNQNNK